MLSKTILRRVNKLNTLIITLFIEWWLIKQQKFVCFVNLYLQLTMQINHAKIIGHINQLQFIVRLIRNFCQKTSKEAQDIFGIDANPPIEKNLV